MMADVLAWLTFVSAIGIASLGMYYTARPRVDGPPPIKAFALYAALLVAVALMMAFAGESRPIYWALHQLRILFTHPLWQWFGVALAFLIYTPLIAKACRRADKRDIVVIIAFLVFALLLFLPGGFDSIAQYEFWASRAYYEGRPSKVGDELVSRFWIHLPQILAMNIDSGSFAGYHLLNPLMFWGQMTFLYGIFRKLGIAPLFAFLTATLFLVYPVNSHLLSLRSFSITFSKLSLLAAVVLALDYWDKPSRLKLLGLLLALSFNVGSYEVGYGIILVVPLLWWRRGASRIWGKIQLTVVWYLAPALKAVYVLLLILTNRRFYGKRFVWDTSLFSLDAIPEHLGVVDSVYQHTLLHGWSEAFGAFLAHPLDLAAAYMLILTGAVACYLSRGIKFPPRRQLALAILVGLLFILLAIGVLMWLSEYNQDLWRMYMYVPLGAAIALSSAILLIASLFRPMRLRLACVVALTLLVMLPAIARLREQQNLFVSGADAKAKILLQIVELAPSFDADAHVILMTGLSHEALEAMNIWELKQNMFDSAVYLLYGEGRPAVAYLCVLGSECIKDDIPVSRGYLEEMTDFSDIVLFRLNEDLSVNLLRELPGELVSADAKSYNPDRLIDYDAPIPPRALSMLRLSQ